MAALRQIIRSCASIQGARCKFPFQSKLYFSSEIAKNADANPGVAQTNSIENAQQFTASSAEREVEEEGGEAPRVVNSIADAEKQVEGEGGVISRPRVANLPEDLTPEQLSRVDEESAAPRAREQAVKDEEVVYPTLVKASQAKKRSPILLVDAIRELKANARKTFDETVEAHVRLGIDPRRSDQTVRGAASLPHGSGKVVRVAVFAEGAAAEEAQAAGADVVGADELVAEVQESGGKLNFDKCIATPSFMPKLGKVARILGPRGLMPNPKVGSVTNNVGDAVRAAKQGRIDFRADKSAIVHAGLGKVSFKEEALVENIAAFTGALLAAKPAGLKKTSRYAGYVNSFVITSTMGSGVRVSLQSLVQAADSFLKSAESR